MLVGGKLLWCDSSATMVCTSYHPKIIAVSGPSIGAANELSSPSTTNPHATQSSYACKYFKPSIMI